MINLFALGVALGVGVPLSITLAEKYNNIIEKYDKHRRKEEIQKTLDNVFCCYGISAAIVDIEFNSNGFGALLDTNTKLYKLNFAKDKLKSAFNCSLIEFVNDNSIYITMNCINEIIDDSEFYHYVPLPNTTLLLGYGDVGYITVDMLKCPHVLITGLSGQGKTEMIKTMLKNLKRADIVLMNGFDDDFKDFKQIRKIKGENDILKYLSTVYENLYKRERPLYLIIEELATIKDKKLNNMIQELLCVARHYNIFIIGVIQIATKEELKFKSYFNARCSFKQLDDSAYRVALGCSVDESLDKREFYLFTDTLYKGHTFTN